jgi:hypothetical protein
VGCASRERGKSGTVKGHLPVIKKFHFTSVASLIRQHFPETWLTSLTITETPNDSDTALRLRQSFTWLTKS